MKSNVKYTHSDRILQLDEIAPTKQDLKEMFRFVNEANEH